MRLWVGFVWGLFGIGAKAEANTGFFAARRMTSGGGMAEAGAKANTEIPAAPE